MGFCGGERKTEEVDVLREGGGALGVGEFDELCASRAAD